MSKKYKKDGKIFYISKSNRKGKEYMVRLPSGKEVHFADPTLIEYPGTKRGDNYCARSYGIGNLKNKKSANYWSRELWSCIGKKSVSKNKFFGKLK